MSPSQASLYSCTTDILRRLAEARNAEAEAEQARKEGRAPH